MSPNTMESLALFVAKDLDDKGEGKFPYSDEDTNWSINVGNEPDDPNKTITIYDVPGELADLYLDLTVPLTYKDNVQVRVRSKDYSQAYNKSRDLFELLVNRGQFIDSDTDTEIGGFIPATSVQWLKKDENNRTIFTFNLQVIRSSGGPR